MKRFTRTKQIFGFTLIETLVGTLIFSIVIISGFEALNSIVIGKVKLIEKASIQKEAFYFSEKLFEMIKTGGLIDYEEYWNRYSYDTSYGSGYFINSTGFGNYGSGGALGGGGFGGVLYSCISKNGTQMGTGCLTDFNINSSGTTKHQDFSSTYQRYGQYKSQFIDYNSDADADDGDEDTSAEANYRYIGDDDDLYLGIGPEAFPSGLNSGELYLINGDGDQRTYFRWSFSLDSNAPTGASCSGTTTMTGTGCLGTIEFLKLEGKDMGYDHSDTVSSSNNDGNIDTWMIHSDFEIASSSVVAGLDNVNYWQPLFPDSIHVKDVKFFPYPNKDLNSSWKDDTQSVNISPYVRISMRLSPSWKVKRKIKGKVPEIEINTTVQLTDIFSN